MANYYILDTLISSKGKGELIMARLGSRKSLKSRKLRKSKIYQRNFLKFNI